MQIVANLELLKADVKKSIGNSQRHRNSDRQKFTLISVCAGIASAVATLSIGLVKYSPPAYENYMGAIALLTSASVSVFLAWDNVFNHKKLWINSATTLHELYELQNDIAHSEAEGKLVPQDMINHFYNRYQNVLRNTNSRWLKIRE
ncbi:SLATT domain-containing protein [Telluria beijingensis]|uniref:SLATT domain-containing protein n=1 Tax=Telluria beijingensis TaxID=3068633 RepID=UPI00279634B2|nr:SLATT domain-containing protein [Massilia sp. REN29]